MYLSGIVSGRSSPGSAAGHRLGRVDAHSVIGRPREMAGAVAAGLAQVDVGAVAAIAVDPATLVEHSTVRLWHRAALHVVPSTILSVLEAHHAVLVLIWRA